MFLLDSVYLTSTSKFYNNIVKSIQGSEIKARYLSAFVCYLFLAFGLYYFILRTRRPPFDAFLLGLVIYGVFETTNHVIFKNWSWKAVVLDTLWGGILFYLTTYIVYNFNK
tara:strand:+ start:88 stop:420 length:333 start_codon:yes stop_codon:yes gene_type:complete